MNAATEKNGIKAGARHARLVWPVLLLGLVGLAASYYSFYKARQHSQAATDLQQTLLTQHRLSSDIRKRWSGGQGLDQLSRPLEAFAQQHSDIVTDAAHLIGGQSDGESRLQLVEVSKRVIGAVDGLRAALPPTTADPETLSTNSATESGERNGPAPGDIASTAEGPGIFEASNNLIETTATLRAILARDAGLPVQTESAGHLYQLAVSVANRLGVNTGDPGKPDVAAARGPWLVFEQILQRMEAMIGTSEITKSDHVVLINDIRSQQLDLKDQFDALENGGAISAQSQGEDSQTNVATARATNSGQSGEASARRNSLADIGTRHSLLDDSLVAFESTIDSANTNRSLWFTLGSLAGLFSAALLTLLFLGMYRSLRLQQQSEVVKDQAQEEDILQLLDEIENLAEGDLSTRASVTEGVTGTIADSINYAVSELRRLVGTLSTSAERVTVAVEETGTSARQLANASAVQSREIGRSSTYIRAMSDTMSQLALRSAEAKAIALESVKLAGSGADSVSATAKTAESVRRQTAEATRMMRRLGDSSSQITRSVKLIDEAAEKTRLLAMNTTIKSRSRSNEFNNDATARGLAEVADQVQGLANRLGQSAAEIETLVTVVQQDVKVALGNMQEIDREVSSVADHGAHGLKCLTQIKSVSERLSSVVRHIDERTQRQSAVIDKLSGNMSVINEVTRQSAHGLQLSASSLEDLRLMSSEMRDSVTEFSLPEKDRLAIAARAESIRAHEHVGAGSETMAVKPHADDTLEGSLYDTLDSDGTLDSKYKWDDVDRVMDQSASDTISSDFASVARTSSTSGLAIGAVAGAAVAKPTAHHADDATADIEQSDSRSVYADSASETFTAAEEYFDDSVADDTQYTKSDARDFGEGAQVDMDHDRTQVLGQQVADLTGNETEILPRPAKSRESDSSND